MMQRERGGGLRSLLFYDMLIPAEFWLVKKEDQ